MHEERRETRSWYQVEQRQLYRWHVLIFGNLVATHLYSLRLPCFPSTRHIVSFFVHIPFPSSAISLFSESLHFPFTSSSSPKRLSLTHSFLPLTLLSFPHLSLSPCSLPITFLPMLPMTFSLTLLTPLLLLVISQP